MEIETSLVIATFGLLVTTITFFYKAINDIRCELSSLDSRIDKIEKTEIECRLKLENRFNLLENKFELWWKNTEDKLIEVLKHPTELIKDALLDKFRIRSLSMEEATQLREILSKELEIAQKEKKVSESFALAFMITSIDIYISQKLT